MNGYEIYNIYLAFKLHFDSEKFDMFKYGGHAPKNVANPEKFELRRDKYMFHKLSRKLKDADVRPFLVSNFIKNRKTWTGDLVKPDAFRTYNEYQKVMGNLNYIFEMDLRNLLRLFNQSTFEDILKPKADGSYPSVLVAFLQKEITIETVCIIHAMTHCLNVWDKQYAGDYIYDETVFVIKKYLPFLLLDMNELKEIAKRVLTET